jgi:5-methylcytosine-specific restriction endonuclease McrA
MEKKVLERYKSKAADSFKTKLDLFFFEMAVKNEDIYEGLINIERFRNFRISKEIKELYINVYWQIDDVNSIIYNDFTAKDIYYKIKDWSISYKTQVLSLKQDYIKNSFPTIFPMDSFEELCKGTSCYYCKITKEKIDELIQKKRLFKKHITRGWTLEIDRKRPNEEYTPENSVLCCYWCNNAKTDEFCDREFLIIGTAIEQIWNARLTKV